jgi:VanZ family protein
MAAARIHAPFRRRLLIVYWIGMFSLTHMPGIGRYAPRFSNSDKVWHMLFYAGWAALWWWLLSAGGRRINTATAFKIFIGGLAYAIFDETTQAIVGRNPSAYDMLADLTGITAALLILLLWQKYRRPRSARG